MENPKEEERNGLDEKKGLSFEDHLHVLISYFLVFTIFTIFVLIIEINVVPENPDFNQETIIWVFYTGVEIILVILVQSIWDKLTRKDKRTFPSLLKKRFLDFGFQKKTSAGTMVKDTLLLLFCLIIPIDLLSYIIPGILEFIANTPVGLRFKGVPLINYLIIGLFYNLTTGVKEEFVFRGYMTKRLHEKGKRYSAWIISSFFFGLLHFSPEGPNIAGPLVWLITATLVGFLFAGYSLSTKQILPLIIAHGVGNFISAFSIWTFHSTAGFSTIPILDFLLVFYVPMACFGCLLALLFRKRIKDGIRALKKLISESKREGVTLDTGIIILVLFVLYISVAFGLQL